MAGVGQSKKGRLSNGRNFFDRALLHGDKGLPAQKGLLISRMARDDVAKRWRRIRRGKHSIQGAPLVEGKRFHMRKSRRIENYRKNASAKRLGCLAKQWRLGHFARTLIEACGEPARRR